MAPEQKRASVCLVIVALFVLLVGLLLRTEGTDAFYPSEAGESARITMLSAGCVFLLAAHIFLFRNSLRIGTLLGDERDESIAIRAGLVARTAALMIVFGAGIIAQSRFAGQDTIAVPRLAIGFGLASLLTLYLGIRAVTILILYGRGR